MTCANVEKCSTHHLQMCKILVCATYKKSSAWIGPIGHCADYRGRGGSGSQWGSASLYVRSLLARLSRGALSNTIAHGSKYLF